MTLPLAERQALEAQVAGRSRAWTIAHAGELSEEQRRAVESLCERRAQGEPLAYITGSAGFYGREFVVNAHVLVPRPETELLVEGALAFLRATGRTRVLDAGTGSGAIACTIAAELSNAAVTASDISPDALAIARANAVRLGVADRCEFQCADIAPENGARFDVIVANLPYIPSAAVPNKPDPVAFEPRVATDGGPDGLREYRKLLAIAPRLIVPGGLVLLEAAPPTVAGLAGLAARAFPQASVSVHCDYAGLERYVRISA